MMPKRDPDALATASNVFRLVQPDANQQMVSAPCAPQKFAEFMQGAMARLKAVGSSAKFVLGGQSILEFCLTRPGTEARA
jgi:hypothetical protein